MSNINVMGGGANLLLRRRMMMNNRGGAYRELSAIRTAGDDSHIYLPLTNAVRSATNKYSLGLKLIADSTKGTLYVGESNSANIGSGSYVYTSSIVYLSAYPRTLQRIAAGMFTLKSFFDSVQLSDITDNDGITTSESYPTYDADTIATTGTLGYPIFRIINYLGSTYKQSPAGTELKELWLKDWNNNGAELFHLVPRQRISDGVVGMLDLISDTFFPNQGTTPFVAVL